MGQARPAAAPTKASRLRYEWTAIPCWKAGLLTLAAGLAQVQRGPLPAAAACGPNKAGSSSCPRAAPLYRGHSVALSANGNVGIVGAPGSGPGQVLVYARSGGTWSQQGGSLQGSGGDGGAAQGFSVALSADGNTMLEGGDNNNGGVGAAWVFRRSVNTHDFNGDGKSDIAWRNTNGDTAIWLMTVNQSGNAQILSSADYGIIPNSWQIVGQRDFNGDGKADLLWSNTNGDTSIWLMNGTQVSSTPDLGFVGNGWSIVGTGDFNGDGFGDILWRNTNGDTSIWLMTGTATQVSVLSATDLGLVPTSWSVAQTGDFNGDGKADILWHNTNGDTSIWLMTGERNAGAGAVGDRPRRGPDELDDRRHRRFQRRRQERHPLAQHQWRYLDLADDRERDAGAGVVDDRPRRCPDELERRRHRRFQRRRQERHPVAQHQRRHLDLVHEWGPGVVGVRPWRSAAELGRSGRGSRLTKSARVDARFGS